MRRRAIPYLVAGFLLALLISGLMTPGEVFLLIAISIWTWSWWYNRKAERERLEKERLDKILDAMGAEAFSRTLNKDISPERMSEMGEILESIFAELARTNPSLVAALKVRAIGREIERVA